MEHLATAITHVIQSGAVDVVVEHEGLRTTKTVLGPYECFGEMSLFTGEMRSATVLALADTVVLKLDKEAWEELIAKYPSLCLHFCKVVSLRLTETERDMSKGRGTFNVVMEEFFTQQPDHIQDFLIQTSILRALDAEAIQSVLRVSDPIPLLAKLSSGYPVFVRFLKTGNYQYLDYLRDFLSARLEQKMPRKERNELHLRFASYFSRCLKWGAAIHHTIKGEAWEKALEHLAAHGDELLVSEPPEEILALLDALPPQFSHAYGHIARLRAETHVRVRIYIVKTIGYNL